MGGGGKWVLAPFDILVVTHSSQILSKFLQHRVKIVIIPPPGNGICGIRGRPRMLPTVLFYTEKNEAFH